MSGPFAVVSRQARQSDAPQPPVRLPQPPKRDRRIETHPAAARVLGDRPQPVGPGVVGQVLRTHRHAPTGARAARRPGRSTPSPSPQAVRGREVPAAAHVHDALGADARRASMHRPPAPPSTGDRAPSRRVCRCCRTRRRRAAAAARAVEPTNENRNALRRRQPVPHRQQVAVRAAHDVVGVADPQARPVAATYSRVPCQAMPPACTRSGSRPSAVGTHQLDVPVAAAARGRGSDTRMPPSLAYQDTATRRSGPGATRDRPAATSAGRGGRRRPTSRPGGRRRPGAQVRRSRRSRSPSTASRPTRPPSRARGRRSRR